MRHPYVTRVTPWACLLAVSAAACAADTTTLLAGVQNRYNRTRTLQVHFEQTYDAPQRGPKTEAGELFLRKPGRMRWQYTQPAGKLFVSDGKFIFLYTPSNNRVERSKVKESDDLRAPLGFLLGKLDFQRDFKRFLLRPQGQDTWIEAEPRSERAPFTKVAFLVTPDYEIRHLIVASEGASTMEFRFAGEKLNPPLPEKLFQFHAPAGAEVVEAAE
ncbi:MAG TPA: outer membrane lipoprotein carrier protein LolA [Bryobacteraceae bacterium]